MALTRHGALKRRVVLDRRGALTRKGFVFTVIAMLIVFALLILAWSEHRGTDRARTRADHAFTAHAYLTNLEQDLPRAAYISSFRCFLALEEYVSTTGAYVENIDTTFAECFANGTINGEEGSLMEDSSFSDLLARFTALANMRGMRVNITPISASTQHLEAFAVTTNVELFISVSDAAQSLAIDRTITIQARVPITDIKDPLHSVGTLGRNPRPIRESNITQPYITPSNDTTNFLALINTGSYILNPNAPSFLMRFEGNFSPSEHGIASLVNIQDLAAQDITINTCASIVDYKYFDSAPTTPNRLIVETNPLFVWLADDDLALYDAVDKTVGNKPCP